MLPLINSLRWDDMIGLRADLKLYNKNGKYVRTVKDVDYSYGYDGVIRYKVPKTKCRFIQLVLTSQDSNISLSNGIDIVNQD